jgi:hypothetical protein
MLDRKRETEACTLLHKIAVFQILLTAGMRLSSFGRNELFSGNMGAVLA